MINATDELILQTSDPGKDIENAVLSLGEFIGAKYADDKNRSNHQVKRSWSEISQAMSNFDGDEKLIKELFQIASLLPSFDNRIAKEINWHNLSVSSQKRSQFISLARQLTFVLWTQKAILPPLDFNFSRAVQEDLRHEFSGDILKFIDAYKATDNDIQLYGRQVQFRINKHSLSWICSTDWYQPEDISLKDSSLVNSIISRRHSSKNTKSVPPNIAILMPVLLKKFRDRMSFSIDDWQNHLVVQRSLSAQQSVANKFGESTTPLYGKGVRDGYFHTTENTEDTEWCFTKEDRVLWNGLISGFIKYRENIKGFEASGTIRKNLFVLADYLSVCLPEAKMLSGYTEGKISAPKDFTRYPFVDQATQKQPFPTFLDFCSMRSGSSGTQRTWLGAARDFFTWVEANYGDKNNKHIAGPQFRNPIITKLDMPRTKKCIKTNKKPFGLRVVPHLLSWLYAIEEFGLHLQSQGHGLVKNGTYDEVKCCQFGLVPTYDFMGETYKVSTAPVALLKSLGPKARVSLTCLRMLILALETGFRVQSTRWLDRRKWDQFNQNTHPQQEVFTLHVNTDKTHGAWETVILGRTRELLQREQAYQESLDIDWYNEPYEGRRNSRFDDVQPLFRDKTRSKTQVISDDKYRVLWKHILFSFQRYALHADLNLPLLCQYKKPKKTKVTVTVDGYQKIDLYEKTFHKPHSCRSTFITRRSSLIGIDALADLVGHSNSIVTSHYDYPEMDELSKKLEVADSAVMSSQASGPQISSGPTYVKAKEVHSALQKSFAANREETIVRYKMISLSSVHNNDEEDKNGIDLLRGSPANEIIFLDTHICPVGEICPQEVIEDVGETRRCGLCQYACKSIDNLPAIAAKRKALKGRIRHNKQLYDTAQRDDDRQDVLEETYGRIHLDTQEYLGWTAAEEILNNLLNDGYDSDFIHTDQPEIVKNHLKRVVKPCSMQEFVLERILEAKTYPALRTDELRLKASRFMRRVMVTDDSGISPFEDHSPDTELEAVATAITGRMKAEGLSISQISEQIDNQLNPPPFPTIAIDNKAGE